MLKSYLWIVGCDFSVSPSPLETNLGFELGGLGLGLGGSGTKGLGTGLDTYYITRYYFLGFRFFNLLGLDLGFTIVTRSLGLGIDNYQHTRNC